MSERIEIWDLWFPNAAAQGLPFGRGRLSATERLLVHAAPETLRVDVYDEEGHLLARGAALQRTADTPGRTADPQGQPHRTRGYLAGTRGYRQSGAACRGRGRDPDRMVERRR